MRRDDDKNFQRAKRLLRLAEKALENTHRYPSLSRQAEHRFRRYLKLLWLTAKAWNKVGFGDNERKYERLAA